MTIEQVSSQKSTIGRINFVHQTVKPLLRGLSRVAPGPASKVARRVFLTPPRHRIPMREIWWGTDAETFEMPFGSGKLAAWRWGWGGPKVLLVHGWAGRGLQLGAFSEPLVEAGFEVVAYDAPGHGRSSGGRSSLPEMAEAVTAMVRHLGGVAGIVAHSLGASATTVALGRPGTPPQVGRLAYLSPAVDMFHVTHRFADLTGFTRPVVARMRSGLEHRFATPWSDFQGLRIAPAMTCPLLVVHDRDDREIAHSESEALARSWPGARLETTSGLGHRRILRDTGVVGGILGFLSGSSSHARPA